MQIDTRYPSKHYSSRGKEQVKAIVVHATAGTNSLGWLIQNPQQVSAHYLIRKDGHIYGMVDLSMAAHHCGYSRFTIDGKTYGPGKNEANPNSCTVGIEIENLNNGKDPYPATQRKAVQDLMAMLIEKYPNAKLYFHRDIDTQGKSDPVGLTWADILPAPPTSTQPDQIVIGVADGDAGQSASIKQITAWLRKRRAAMSDRDIEQTATMCRFLNIDASFVFALMAYETSIDGTFGASELATKAKNMGGIKAYGDRWPSYRYSGVLWNAYESQQLGAFGVVFHLKQIYGAKGLLRIAEIINVYAPPSENATSRYVTAVCTMMDEMRVIP